MLQLYTYVIDITSKPLFFVHFVDDVDLNVTFQVFLFSLVGLKCCGFLFFFSDLHYVRWGNKTAKLKIPWIIFCHIYSPVCSPTYLHATLCPLGKQLFTQKLKLYSLEASSHKHFHTESHSLYSFSASVVSVSVPDSEHTRSRETKKNHKLNEKMKYAL